MMLTPGICVFFDLANNSGGAAGPLRTMFFFEYEPIQEENESKLSSQGDIRTDLSNTDDSFELDVNQITNFCDEPGESEEEAEQELPLTRARSIS